VKRHMALQHYMCDEREEGGAFRGALARDVLFSLFSLFSHDTSPFELAALGLH
jgi:hypothetical protein